MSPYLIGITCLLFFSSLASAKDSLAWLTFYDKNNVEIADIWIEMPDDYLEKLTQLKAEMFKWRGRAAPNYNRLYPSDVSVGKELNNPEWQQLQLTLHTAQGKEVVIINLQPHKIDEFAVILYYENKANPSNRKWNYSNGGESGTFKFH